MILVVTQTQIEKQVVREKREKSRSDISKRGRENLVVKVTWYYTKKRDGRRYYYPRLHIPVDVLEKLGIRPREPVAFEVEIIETNGERALILKPKQHATSTA